MPFLHPNQPLLVTTINGQDFVLFEPLLFRLRSGRFLRGKTGAATDGLSSPKFAKCNIQDGNTFFPAASHDFGYRDQLEESPDKGATWRPVTLSKPECDDMFRELLEDNGVDLTEAEFLYYAVRDYAQTAFDDDRKAQVKSVS